MIVTLIQSAVLLGFPALVLKLCQKSKVLNMAGPVILCYAAGLLMANIPMLPVDTELSALFVNLSVPLAIVLLLFPTDILHWLRHAGKAILSFGLCIVAVITSALAASWLFSLEITDSEKIAGMLVGVYTGGTPNMSAIGLSLGVDNETFILINSADIVVGGIYLLFLMSVAQKVMLRFLPAFKADSAEGGAEINRKQPKNPSLSPVKKIVMYIKPLLLSVAVLAAGAGISFLLYGAIEEIAVILSVTTLGIAATFIPKVRKLEGSYPAGEYLLMIFCISVGSLASFEQLINSSVTIFLCVAFVMFSSILIHFLLAAFFRIDADTVLITSTAGIYGPAFVPVIARTLNNREVLMSGLTTGLVGYAVATYLGIAVYYILG